MALNSISSYYLYTTHFRQARKLEEIISHHISCWVPGVVDMHSLQTYYFGSDAAKYEVSLYTKDVYIRSNYTTWSYHTQNSGTSSRVNNLFSIYLNSLLKVRLLILQIQYDFVYNDNV